MLITALLISPLSFAQSASQSSTTENASTSESVPTSAGRKAYIDPDTGELTSQPSVYEETLQPSRQVFQQSSAGLVEELQPDGSTTVNLQGRFRMPLMIRKNCDGSLTTWHGDEEQANKDLDCDE